MLLLLLLLLLVLVLVFVLLLLLLLLLPLVLVLVFVLLLLLLLLLLVLLQLLLLLVSFRYSVDVPPSFMFCSAVGFAASHKQQLLQHLFAPQLRQQQQYQQQLQQEAAAFDCGFVWSPRAAARGLQRPPTAVPSPYRVEDTAAFDAVSKCNALSTFEAFSPQQLLLSSSDDTLPQRGPQKGWGPPGYWGPPRRWEPPGAPKNPRLLSREELAGVVERELDFKETEDIMKRQVWGVHEKDRWRRSKKLRYLLQKGLVRPLLLQQDAAACMQAYVHACRHACMLAAPVFRW